MLTTNTRFRSTNSIARELWIAANRSLSNVYPSNCAWGVVLAPDDVLKLIKCRCESEDPCASMHCECVRAGFGCIIFFCQGSSACRNEQMKFVYGLKKNNTHFSTNPSDPVFCADPAICIAFQKKIKRFPYLLTLKCFRKLDKKLKNVRIAKLMLRIIFFNSLDVLNFIICMFSGTVDDI